MRIYDESSDEVESEQEDISYVEHQLYNKQVMKNYL
jgi:hypothetical protein